MNIKVLIVDDDPLGRQGMTSWLSDQDEIEVVGEASNETETFAFLEKQQPDIICMDVSLHGMFDRSGIELTRKILEKFPTIRIIGCSMREGIDDILSMFDAGASGFVAKRYIYDAEILVKALREVLDGKLYCSPEISQRVLATLLQRNSGKNKQANLTERELEVLILVAQGKTVKEIGSLLFLSERTVETHKHTLKVKLGAHTDADLVKEAIRRGLIIV
ncbi:MAG: response regulator transcription factor [Ignavibacteriae bacterium]|nr:response regulator transcription factor [Ignavibacteriota bacterium]